MQSAPTEHIQTVQRLYAAFASRNIGAILGAISPAVKCGEPDNPYNPAAGTRQGHAGFLEWLRVGRDSEEVLSLDLKPFLVSADSVAVVGHTTCKVKATGKSYATDFIHLITFNDGLVVEFREFFDTYAASEAFKP